MATLMVVKNKKGFMVVSSNMWNWFNHVGSSIIIRVLHSFFNKILIKFDFRFNASIKTTLQNLANQVEFGEYKEDFMKGMNCSSLIIWTEVITSSKFSNDAVNENKCVSIAIDPEAEILCKKIDKKDVTPKLAPLSKVRIATQVIHHPT
ncbi:hypothetical protein ACTA71_004876 [Dictyostelium dimigraforme]